uniref:Uncharacterized protein LOC113784359 n=1 Tax=Cicer arietinum TaxID=3827 RepID=A0A3Q7XIT3_CICAR|nr:uncharacterized protein LOC113784359 [Cicer arietinum]
MGNQVQGSMVHQQAYKKKKTIPKCPAMSLTKYLNKNKEQHGVEDSGDEDIEENEMEEGINYESEESEGTNGLIKKRGKTICRKIHSREFKDRQEIILNEEGQPIGPDEKTVSEFSSFLETIARSSDLCPLTFNNWKALIRTSKDLNIDPVWDYLNQKYIIPEKGRKDVFAILNNAWRRYKCFLKKEHFSKYKTTREQLKNRPHEISEEDFKNLLEYWKEDHSQEISHQNAQNIAQLKYRHRMGNKGFAVIREKWYSFFQTS